MARREREDPTEWSPQTGVDRYLRRRQSDATDSSIKSFRYRLKLFVEWLEAVGVSEVGELEAWDFDEYFDVRSGDISTISLENEMRTLKQFVEYLESLGAVQDDLSKSVPIPDIDKSKRADSTALKWNDAKPLIDYYRDSSDRATRGHALLEIAWYVGARRGAIRALDIRDFNVDGAFLEFHHRPETDTPLKNKLDSERPVGIPSESVDVLTEYIDEHRYDVEDDYGRRPLLASSRGRPAKGTVRDWMYNATIPCIHGPCPHDRDPNECEWTEYARASNCPSSRSPHQVRTGSITWQLNLGVPASVVSERVDATVDTIKDHYDHPTREARWGRFYDRLETRRGYVNQLDPSES